MKASQIKLVFFILSLSLVTFAPTVFASTAKYYRYVNKNGTPSISRTVSPEMIRLGYQEFDSNMNFIRAVPPYNSQYDSRQGTLQANKAEQAKKDLQLKRAYHNVEYATRKKTEALHTLQKQIDVQQASLNKLQEERQKLYSQKANLINSKQPSPIHLQNNISNNEIQLKQAQANLERLNTQYKQETKKYDQIIQRLRAMQ